LAIRLSIFARVAPFGLCAGCRKGVAVAVALPEGQNHRPVTLFPGQGRAAQKTQVAGRSRTSGAHMVCTKVAPEAPDQHQRGAGGETADAPVCCCVARCCVCLCCGCGRRGEGRGRGVAPGRHGGTRQRRRKHCTQRRGEGPERVPQAGAACVQALVCACRCVCMRAREQCARPRRSPTAAIGVIFILPPAATYSLSQAQALGSGLIRFLCHLLPLANPRLRITAQITASRLGAVP